MREGGDQTIFKGIIEEFEKNKEEHVAVYGYGNEERCTGSH